MHATDVRVGDLRRGCPEDICARNFGDCSTQSTPNADRGTRNDAIQPNGTPVLPGPGAWPSARHRDVRLLKQL